MWNEYVTNNYFLKKLYNKIPPLENIIIRDISIRNIFGSANDLEIEFEMPNLLIMYQKNGKNLIIIVYILN